MNAPGTTGLGAMGAAMGAGAPPAPVADPTADPTAGADKSVLITAKADGSFEVQLVGPDMQPTGDPIPAKSIDEAMQGAQDALTGGEGAEGTPGEESTESSAEEATEPAGEAGGSGPGEAEPAPGSDEEKAQYASKRGTRPKSKPSWGDYMAGGNPMAK